jgi:prepilin-type N-terminal cleavage/methylation domain-containing protein
MIVIGSDNNHLPKQSHASADEIASVGTVCQRRNSLPHSTLLQGQGHTTRASRWFPLSRNDVKAFTLAEVLITLGIIGIVAAMTIPTLMNNTNEKEHISAWKKDFSVISQAWLTVVNENGGNGTISSNTGADLSNDYGNALTAKMKVSKICLANSDSALNSECWHKANEFYTLNKQAINGNYSTLFSAILNDGTFIVVGGTANPCNDNSSQCFFAGIDVNGAKKTNIQGKDIFYLGALGGGRVDPHSILRDASDTSDPYNCVETSPPVGTNQGQGCSKLALYCNDIDYSAGKCKP